MLSWGKEVVCGQLMVLSQMAGSLKIGCVSGCSWSTAGGRDEKQCKQCSVMYDDGEQQLELGRPCGKGTLLAGRVCGRG